MDKYIVSARKYRPATFKSVVGQKALTSTLKNAIATDRLAQAYLFCGPRGVGKTSCARIFAKTINCLNPTPDGEACCQCESCKAIERGASMNVVELDAASNNSVDDIRDITDQVQTQPQGGKYRVFIIDEVHMLSSAAFNAFLKTLEEPPKYVIFILATTEKHKVLPTILSRCQTYDFRRITIEDMVEQMQYIGDQEGIKTDPRGLEVIARKADGAMRDALSIFDQVAASSRGDITYESTIENLNVLDYDYYFRLVESFRTGDIPGALLLYRDVRAKGFDSLFFLNGLADHVRNLMVAADPRTAELLETSRDVAQRYTQQAKSLPLQWYYAAMKVLNDGDVQYRTATNKQFLVELVLIRLAQLLKPATPPFDLVDRDYPLGDITGQARPQSAAPAPPQSTPTPPPPTARPSVAPQPQQPNNPTTQQPQQPNNPTTPTTQKAPHLGSRLPPQRQRSGAEEGAIRGAAQGTPRSGRPPAVHAGVGSIPAGQSAAAHPDERDAEQPAAADGARGIPDDGRASGRGAGLRTGNAAADGVPAPRSPERLPDAPRGDRPGEGREQAARTA